ncbi:VIER F-box protein 2 [Tanacetum coccineum]|uniref:VIER F-box protein 2 n=1 Tax=Tanacetum coccineum TaxID=301880 RepID=A0ABQ5EX15_9ASTR
MKVEESLNVTFDESPPLTKLSPLVDDDVGEEEAIENNTKVVNNNNAEDESIGVDEVVNIKKSKNHPLEQFEMSMMGELNFFLGLQIKQMEDEIFFNQSKYIKEMLKKFGLEDSKPTKTPMSTEIKITKDNKADSVDNTKYQGDLDNSTSNVLIPLDSWTSGLLVYKLPLSVRMTKVIKGEFEKIKDVKVEDVSLTCDASLEVFNDEVSRLSKMDDDLFTYKVEVADIPCDSKMDNDSEQEADDDMGYDPSDIRGDDEVELTDEESSDIFDYETPLYSAFNEFNYLLKDVPWVDEKPWIDAGIWTKPTLVKHTCKPFNYKTGCSEWPTCGWKDDGYCNGGNLPGAYIIGNQLHYQDYEWYEALVDYKLKDEALRNKAIMEGSINEDDDDESRYEQKRQWNTYTNYDDAYEINHEHNKSKELCEIQEQPVCNIRRYMVIKYSFNDDEKYVAVKEDEYNDLTVTRKETCRAYQEIFQIMDE